VRLSIDGCHDERDVGFREFVADLLPIAAQLLSHLWIAKGGLVVNGRIVVELSEAASKRLVG
jgi:hypothetical protein